MKHNDVILDEGWMIGANWLKNHNDWYVPQVNTEDMKALAVQQNAAQIFNGCNNSDVNQGMVP